MTKSPRTSVSTEKFIGASNATCLLLLWFAPKLLHMNSDRAPRCIDQQLVIMFLAPQKVALRCHISARSLFVRLVHEPAIKSARGAGFRFKYLSEYPAQGGG